MNFFKSILSDDTDPENMDEIEKSELNQSQNHEKVGEAEEELTNLNLNSNSNSSDHIQVSGGGGSLWSFGDLVKTLTTRSESVLETYRRDLKEFGSGLRKESDLFREVASRAVKELPASIEVVGASAIDGVWKSTAEIISQGKESLLEPSDDSDSSNNGDRSLNSTRGYSRFDSQLNAIQSDVRTYCLDPEDLDDFQNWKLGFMLGDKETEIEKLIGENGVMESIYKKVVPNEVDHGSFWCRYFFRVHKLKMQEDTRANLVRRSLNVDDEEELSWDVDDDDEEKHEEEANRVKSSTSNDNNSTETEKIHESDKTESEIQSSKVVADDVLEKKAGSANVGDDDQKVESVAKSDEKDVDLSKKDGKTVVDEKPESVTKANENDEDIEWDEIEDLGETDEKKVSKGENTIKKQANVVEDDEDLSWDIEEDDDDEPVVKTGNK